MEKNHLMLLQFHREKQKGKIPKKRLVVERKDIEHIATEKLRLKEFKNEKNYATFTFGYFVDSKEWDIVFELEIIVDTLVVEFIGEEIPESVRIKASKILEDVVQALRFKHKDKYWVFSHYYIGDVEEYEQRKKNEFPRYYESEIEKIFNLSKIESMSDDNHLFFELEEIEGLSLFIVGEDGKVLCEYLEEKGFIYYEEVKKNRYIIEFVEDKIVDEEELINRKIVFAREIAQYGYNIWVDYNNNDL